MWVVTLVMWPYFFLRLSWPSLKIYKTKKLRNHDGHFFPPTTTPLLVIQTCQVANIIINNPTTLLWSTICYRHRGWLTRLRRRWCIAHDIKTFFSSTTWIISSINDCCGAVIFSADRYICLVAWGYIISQSDPSHSAQADVQMIFITIEFYSHLHEH